MFENMPEWFRATPAGQETVARAEDQRAAERAAAAKSLKAVGTKRRPLLNSARKRARLGTSSTMLTTPSSTRAVDCARRLARSLGPRTDSTVK